MNKSIRGMNINRQRAKKMYIEMCNDYIWTELVEDTKKARHGFQKIKKKYYSIAGRPKK